MATAIATLASTAISSVELYQEQEAQRAEAEAAGRRAKFLAEASAVLSSSLDYTTTLSQVASLAVPFGVGDDAGQPAARSGERRTRL